MKKIKKTLPVLCVAVLFAATAGCAAQNTDTLQASGVIEATEVNVSAEVSGQVAEVLAEEGDSVQAGDLLFRLDGGLLQSQHEAAAANLEAAKAGVSAAQAGVTAAQAQYDLALSAALAQDGPTRAADLSASPPSEFDQPGWYFTQEERIQAAQAEVDAVQAALADARSQLANTEQDAANADFLSIEERLSQARVAYQVAQAVLAQANSASDGRLLREAAQDALDDAKDELNNAQEAYDDALTTDAANDVLEARAKQNVAQQRYYAALDALHALQTGEFAPGVTAAATALDQANAGLEQAQAAAAAAEANLALMDTQMEKLSVRSPLNGVVLVRSIEAGETLQAGLPAFTVGRVDTLKVVVYLPEDQYGRLSLGDEGTLSVDAYPDESFTATVTRIADHAEYTPRNVQTAEERQTTVYAVELSLDNTAGKLKPGMQADISFTLNASGN